MKKVGIRDKRYNYEPIKKESYKLWKPDLYITLILNLL